MKNYIKDIKDFDFKVELLNISQRKQVEKDVIEYYKTGVVSDLLVYLHDISIAEILYNNYGITEWDKKKLSLDDEDMNTLYNILMKIHMNNGLSEEEIEFLRIIKLPYPEFVREYFKNYIASMPEVEKGMFSDKTFPYKLYIARDYDIQRISDFIKTGKYNSVNDALLMEFSAPLSDFYKYQKNASEDILYILRYANEDIINQSPFSDGNIDAKMDLFNEPLNSLLKLSIGLTSGGHQYHTSEIKERIPVSDVNLKRGIVSDYEYHVLYKTKDELISYFNMDPKKLENSEFVLGKNVQLPHYKSGSLKYNIKLAYDYALSKIPQEEFQLISSFAQEESQKTIMPYDKIMLLIVAYYYITNDINDLETMVSLDNLRGFSRGLCESIIEDYEDYLYTINNEPVKVKETF